MVDFELPAITRIPKKTIKAKQKQKSLWREQTKLFFPRTKSRKDNDITRSWIQVNAHPSRDAIRYNNENMHETMRLWMDVIMPYKFICFLINRLTFTINKQIKDTLKQSNNQLKKEETNVIRFVIKELTWRRFVTLIGKHGIIRLGSVSIPVCRRSSH